MDPQAGPQSSRVEGYSLAQPQPKGLPFGTANVPRQPRFGRGLHLAILLFAAACIGLAPPLAAEAADDSAGPIQTAATESRPASDQTGALPARDSAKDKAPSPAEEEAAYYAQLDKITDRVLDYELSKDDAKNIRDAISALYSDKVEKADALRAEVSDPLGRKLIDWYRLRSGNGEAAEYAKFLKTNPDWPSRQILQRRMEEVLFAKGGSTEAIASYFKSHPPTSAAGMAVLASVHLAHGQKDKAQELAAKIWREDDFSQELERGFLARFGPLLSEDDHKWRLDRLLVDDVRWKRARNRQAAKAKRVIPLLSKSEQKKAKARLDVFLRKRGKTRIKTASKPENRDWGLVFHKIQSLRRRKKLEEAAKLMRQAPTDPSEVVNLDDWWSERQKLAYHALKENKPKLAYELVCDAGPLSVNPLNEQSFMAGWIALRYLNDPDAAERHFASYTNTADGPLGRAKSNYWLGRAAEAKGADDKATAAYKAAAAQPDTFHGLLALQKLHPGRRNIVIDAPDLPTLDQARHFESLDLARVVALAKEADLSRTIKLIFLKQIYKLEDDEAWAALAAHLAREIGDTQVSVQIAKAAIARGQNLIYYSYPVHALPKYKPLRTPPETAVLLGLARQETEFNTGIVSGAGARGILQVMRGTARYVCRQYKIRYSSKKLQHDSSYNTRIASAYVADRMDDFSGSYVLGLSSYNAGPGRTRQWIREFGDPRDAHIDPIDWIERIPIEETRRYVAKVLSNIQIYRARLGDADTALRIDKDLTRAKQAAIIPPEQKPAHATSTARSGG